MAATRSRRLIIQAGTTPIASMAVSAMIVAATTVRQSGDRSAERGSEI
jgi:hypothetical protein